MPVEKIQEEAVALSKVIARDRLEMAGRAPALEPRRRPTGRVPGLAISLGPKIQRQRADAALCWPDLVHSDCLIR